MNCRYGITQSWCLEFEQKCCHTYLPQALIGHSLAIRWPWQHSIPAVAALHATVECSSGLFCCANAKRSWEQSKLFTVFHCNSCWMLALLMMLAYILHIPVAEPPFFLCADSCKHQKKRHISLITASITRQLDGCFRQTLPTQNLTHHTCGTDIPTTANTARHIQRIAAMYSM